MRRRVLAALLFTGLLGSATAFAAPNGGIELVDRPSGFGPLPFDGINHASVGRHAMSDNGCFVVIESENDVLSALDNDKSGNIYRVDRCTPGHPATLVTTTKDGTAADGDSFGPSISADGTKVAFTTAARNLLPPGTTVDNAVVVKDMTSGDLTVASRETGANGAIVDSFEGVISGDGSAIAFQARGAITASNATGVDGQEDVYVRYPGTGDTRMASVTKTANARGGADRAFDISYDGVEVALVTQSALDPGNDSDGHNSAYLIRNLLGTAGTITVDKVSAAETPDSVAISSDGTRVAFTDDRVWTTTCAPACGAPVAQDGAAPTGSVQNFAVGFPVGLGAPTHLFWTTDRGLITSDTDGEFDFYILDLGPSTNLFRVPHHAGGVFGGDFDPGDAAVFEAADPALPGTDGVRGQVFVWDDGNNTTLISLPDGETRRGQTYDTTIDPRHAVSQQGRFVVMSTASPGLGAPSPGPGRFWIGQIVVRDVLNGVTTNVSTGSGGVPADRFADTPTIDALGGRVAFESQATNLVAGATDAVHVYVRDLATGTLQRVDRTADGSAPADGGHDAVISGDGTKVVFISNSPDLPDANGADHAYLADLATGGVQAVDLTADGTLGDADVRDADLSTDGSRVAFVSPSKNLGAFATAENRVFVKDVTGGALTFASPPESGTPAVSARAVTLSGDASKVGWTEDAPGFGYGSDGREHVFVRDLAAGTTTLASTGGPTGSGAFEEDGDLDATGARLAFVRRFDDHTPNVVLVRDVATGAITDLMPAHGPFSFEVSLSPDGQCAAVNSNAANALATGNPSPDFDHVYLVGAGADCPPVPPGGGPGTKDTTPPAISRLRLTRKRFAVAKKRTAITSRRRAKRGTTFLFTLSENARTSIAIARARPGRRSGKRCVKPRKKLKRRCTRFVVQATLTRTKTKQGANKVAFTGRLGKRKLKPGRYRATVGAVDAAGNRAKPRRVSFRVVRR